MPERFALSQNQPNPFNPSTTIKFSLLNTASVQLCIYDVSGKLIKDLIDSHVMDAGLHETAWDGRDNEDRQVPAGVYFYRLVAGEFVDVRRMALVK
ncbi:MAG: T9SS type A sorting domain-containing protein [bacterium]|nr:T9SS type A sorting domain-containing protein [bacterium]